MQKALSAMNSVSIVFNSWDKPTIFSIMEDVVGEAGGEGNFISY